MTKIIEGANEVLAPCPLCGSDASEIFPDWRTNHFIKCDSCGCRTATHVASHGGSARDDWNRRALPQPSAEVERMREALRRLIDTYKDMQDGDGNPCPDVAFARAVLNGGKHG